MNGRFAPSPTGEIHAGTIFAALQAWLISHASGGEIILRIEDLDPDRSRQEYADEIMRNYESLGLSWDRGPFYQHDRTSAYREAFEQLRHASNAKSASEGIIYPCFCTRADLRFANAPHLGEHQTYDRRCLKLSEAEITARKNALKEEGRDASYRIKVPNKDIAFSDIYQGDTTANLERECGDFIIRRSDTGYAYQLAVVVDDAEQKIDVVARGYDLLPSTPQQIFLQQSLGLPTPKYAHFPLFCAPSGRRLAKRNKDASYKELLAKLKSPEAVLGHIAYIGKLQEKDEPTTPEELLEQFDIAKLANLYKNKISIEYDCA